MNRIIIGLLVFFAIILSGITFYLNYSSWKPFRCNAHMNSHMFSMEGKKLELNLNINIIVAQEGRIELLAVGSLKGPNENYAISRRMFISSKHTIFKGFTKTIITREVHHPIDNIPDEIWQRYVLPEAPAAAFYMETRRLSNNLVFVKGLTSPFFVCAVIEN